MTVVGDASKWIGVLDSLIPDIFQLVLTSWQAMPPLAPDTLEDPTTEALCRMMRQNRNASDLPLRIDIQMIELEPAAGQDQGRLDIAFSPLANRENIYFCLECKRLNVPQNAGVRALANEYVVFGMTRFVNGQYGAAVGQGGMMGYVLNGDLNAAIGNVTAAIGRHAAGLGMTLPAQINASTIQPNNPHMRETFHARSGSLSDFLIHHIFVV